MTKLGIDVDRGMMAAVPGGFIAFGAGADIDRAFDAAVTVERFEVGTSGAVPTLADVDPASDRVLAADPAHPYVALDRAMREVAEMPPGVVLAQAVTSMAAWRHEKRRVRLDGVEHRLPATPGLILPLHDDLRAALGAGLGEDVGEEPGTLVGAELLGEPRRKYKVRAVAVKGTRQARYGVFCDGTLLESQPTMSLARRAALERARAAGGELELDVRPWIGRNDGDPFVRVERTMTAQRAVVRVFLATEKRPERRQTAGWVFSGRLSR